MDCIFGFIILALLLILINQYLDIKRDGFGQQDKDLVLRNTGTLEVIKDSLAKNIQDFEIFKKDVDKNKKDNKNNGLLLETQVKQGQKNNANEQKKLASAVKGL